MTYSRFGLTSRTLREAVAHEVATAYGYDADDLLGEPRIERVLQTSISAKGWTVYVGGRDSCVSWMHDDRSTATNRDELVAEVADTGFPEWRDAIAGVMRERSLRSAGHGEWDAAPTWSVLVSPLLMAVGAVAGIPTARLSLLTVGGSGDPSFADLLDGEPLVSTPSYSRADPCPRDHLRGQPSHLWWRLEQQMQLVADERFPIRSVSVGPVETVVEMRHGLPETQMMGLPGQSTGAFIGLEGIEPGTPGGNAPIRRTEHSDMWDRMSFAVDTVHVPAAEAPAGIDMRWAAMFAARRRRRTTDRFPA